jgi:hypothetical protein
MGRILLAVAASLFLVMGGLHGIWTLQDLVNPRRFAPTDDRVRVAMQGARLGLNPRANLWLAWLGFNLSHSLGLALFGAGLLALAWRDFALFSASGIVHGAALAVAAAYVVLAVRFWFWAPALGACLALLCIVGSLMLA